MESIIQHEKRCYVCYLTEGIEEHHIIFGTGRRELSEQYGLKVWLCHRHHRDSKYGVHFAPEFDKSLKELAQRCFEAVYPELNFVEIFGENYIDREKDRKEFQKWEKQKKRKHTKSCYRSKSTRR